MINENSFVVGYDDDEITALVPAKLRLTAEKAVSYTHLDVYKRQFHAYTLYVYKI